MLLLVPNRKVKKAANIILLAAKLLNLYSHFAIDDAFERMAPTLVFFFMLVCRMVVDWQHVKSQATQVSKNQKSGKKYSSVHKKRNELKNTTLGQNSVPSSPPRMKKLHKHM